MYRGKRSAPSPRARLIPAAVLAVVLLSAAVFAALALRRPPAQTPQPSPSQPAVPSLTPAPASTPTPAPPPAPTPDPAERLLAEMTLHEKVCQLFVVQPADLVPGFGRVTAAGEATRRALERYPVAGLLYDASNLETIDQTRTMLANVQSYSQIPLILTCDE